MVQSKYKVGDIIGFGTRPYFHRIFVIKAVDQERYYLETIDGFKSVSPVIRLVDSPGTTFRKVSKTDMLLYYNGHKSHFKFFLKICNQLENIASF